MKKFLSWLLVITMMTGLLPTGVVRLDLPDVTAHAAHEEDASESIAQRPQSDAQTMELTETVSGYCGAEGDNLVWTLTPSGTLTISGTGAMELYWIDLHNPNMSHYAPWHDYSNYITDLVIDEGVTSISDYIFWECYYLTSAVIPDSVTELGYGVFASCSALKSVVIGDGVTEIKGNTFDSCTALERVEIGAGVVSMDFDRVSDSIFYNCTSLKKIVVDENCPLLSSIDGVLFDKTGETLLRFPSAKSAEVYTIPDSVKTIYDEAFANSSALTSVVIPDTVETIAFGAFIYSSLESATIGATTTERNAFYGCTNLKTVTFTSGARTIGPAFSYSGLTEVTIPSTVQSIEESFTSCKSLKKVSVDCKTISGGAFAYCTALTNLTIGENVRTISSYAFCDTGLTELTIPGTVNTIESDAFWNCTALKTLVIEDGITTLGSTAFQDCTALEMVTLPGSITNVGYSVFWNCSALEIVTLKDGSMIIGNDMFEGCIALHTINIPLSLTTIGSGAFADCTNLTTVNYPGTEAQWMGISIGDDNDPLWAAIGYEDPGPGGGCGGGSTNPSAECPDFTLTTLDGETITQDSFGENTMLIIFYRTVCGNSQAVIRALANSTLTDTYDLKIIAVEIDGASEDKISDFALEYGNNGKNIIFCKDGYLYSSSFRSASGNNGNTLPFLYVVKTSTITEHSSGYVTIEEIEEMLLSMPDTPDEPDVPDDPGDPGEPDEPVDPDEITASGTCGENLTWELTADGTLTIRGEGEMAFDDLLAPWYDYSEDIINIVIEEGVTSIADFAFCSHTALTDISLPDGLTSIGDFAFTDCAVLTSIVLPDSVTSIGSQVFDSCTALSSVKLSAGLTKISVSAFWRCTALSSITLPIGITEIDTAAFMECSNLKSITIGENLKSIGYEAFDGCTSLASIYYAGTEDQWNAIKISSLNGPLLNAKIVYESTHTHTPETVPGIPATCTQSGLSEGEKCSICGDILVEQKETPALGHDYDDGTIEVSSGCETSGLVRYACQREGCDDNYTEETPAHGHKERILPRKQPTMTEPGLTAGKDCAICGKILLAQEEIAPVAPEATDMITETVLGELLAGSNGKNLYHTNARWDDPIGSYLIENADGTISILRSWTLEGEDDYGLRVYTYSKSLTLLETKYIPWELPLFGGFYSGEEYNYIVFGQENWEEDDTLEVIRLVKYDKEFNRIGSIAVCDAYTCVPFDAGSLRMAENGNELIVHTARTRYKADDGVNHQSQLTIYFDTENMSVTSDNLGAFQANHVSHSFNQFVIYDGNDAVLLDHGDAYPRSIVLQKETDSNLYEQYTSIDLLKIPGDTGANCTGVSIGDFTQSESSYLAAINTIDHSLATAYDSFNIYFVEGVEYEERNAVLLVVNKETMKTTQVYLSDYVGSGKTTSAPKLVPLGKDRFLAIWGVFSCEMDEYTYPDESDEYGVSFVVVDGSGNRLTPIKHQSGIWLSDCQPIVWNGTVAWYVDKTADFFEYDSTRILYQIDLSEVLGDAAHTPETIPGKAPTCEEPGLTDGTKCADCGKVLVAQEEIPALGHTEETIPGKEPTLTETGLTEGKKCSVCGKILLEQEEIPVLEEISGTCGANLTWTLTKDGVLTISGEGEMFSFTLVVSPLSITPMSEDTESAPWGEYTALIAKVIVKDGVTSIGDNAFAACENLKEIEIPETVTAIGDNAFSGCEALETITYTGSEEQWDEIEIGAGNETFTESEVVIADILLGDVNGDGKVNGTDTNLIFRHVSGTTELSGDQLKAADVNGDGKINGTDTNLVFRFVSGTLDKLG